MAAAREASGLHALGRFESLPPANVPQVEEHAFRAIQRVSRGHESRRPRMRDSGRPRTRGVFTTAARAWLASVALLIALSVTTAAAVGYALDPSDLVGALQRESALAADEQTQHLHPLLRAAPRATRPALASILRARIAGVHELPVGYQDGGATVQCTLVEHAAGQTEARLAELRETGREVSAPPAIAAQLHEHGRALRSVNPRAPLELTPLCLAL